MAVTELHIFSSCVWMNTEKPRRSFDMVVKLREKIWTWDFLNT